MVQISLFYFLLRKRLGGNDNPDQLLDINIVGFNDQIIALRYLHRMCNGNSGDVRFQVCALTITLMIFLALGCLIHYQREKKDFFRVNCEYIFLVNLILSEILLDCKDNYRFGNRER